MITKQQRAALNGFKYNPPSAHNIRAWREDMRFDIAESSYFGDLAPTVVWVPDYLIIAWAEMDFTEDEVYCAWTHLLHTWPSRGPRRINTATAFVQVFLAIANGTARDSSDIMVMP